MMKRRIAAISAVAMLASVAFADERIEVRAAEASARQNLRGQVMALVVAPGVTVRSLSDREASSVGVDEMVAGAQPLGGPRVMAGDVIEVKLNMPARTVFARLAATPEAQRDPRLTPGVLKRLEREWADRQLQASGQAVPAKSIAAMLAGSPAPGWGDVPEQRRLEAAQRAQAAAAQNIVSAGGAIRVGPGDTAGAHFKPEAITALGDWARTMPATRLQLRDDRQVEVGLYVDKPSLFEQLSGVIAGDATTPLRESIANGVKAMPVVIVGRAPIDEPKSPPRAAVVVRNDTWTDRLLTAEATASDAGNKLRTARRAEAEATASLRIAIEALPLDEKQTIGQAAAKDPAVRAAVDRALSRARAYQVTYRADGSVTLRVSLEAGEMIDALQQP